MSRFVPLVVLVLSAVASVSVAQTPVPVGTEFQVNTYTTGAQRDSDLAYAPDGGFIVVWGSDGSYGDDTSNQSIQAQRYASDGSPSNAQFQVNSYTTNRQGDPEVGAASNGDFVVVWTSNGSNYGDTSPNSIQGQRFASNGAPSGSQFQVNSYTTGSQRNSDVATGPDGDFVVVWGSNGSNDDDTSNESVQGRRFASDGTPVGGQFQVNSYTTNRQGEAAVAANPLGGFVVVWSSDGSDNGDPSGYSIQGQMHAVDGSPIGDQFLINSYTTDSQAQPSVATDPDGGFVVAWTSYGSQDDTLEGSIQARRFASNGDPQGDQFQVNSYTTGNQYLPRVAVGPDGDFVVAWWSNGSPASDTSYGSIQGQRFGSSGEPRGAQFQVNSFTTDLQFTPSVGMDSNGDFAVVWTSNGSAGDDTSSQSVQGQRFRVPDHVGDRVWFDLDGNGVQDGGEPGAPGVSVRLYDSEDDSLLAESTTDSAGRYALVTGAGAVYLKFDPPDGYAFTTRDAGPDDVDSDVNSAGFTSVFYFDGETTDDTWDAGLISTDVQVGNAVWLDEDEDGMQEIGEFGVSGVEVRLYREPDPPLLTESATLVGTTVTDGNGLYWFVTEPGTFYLEFLCPSDGFTALDQGDDNLDSDVDPTTGTTSPFAVAPSSTDVSRDAGILDTDSDGVVCSDNCPTDANPAQIDTDGDGSGDACDLCAGDDAGGDADGDGLCAGSPFECDDADPTNACAPVFGDGFESGDTSSWASTVP